MNQMRMMCTVRQSAPVCLRLAAALGLLAALIPVSGCRSSAPQVAVIPRTTGTALWDPMHVGVAETARAAALPFYWNAPADEGDSDKQLSLFEACRAKGYRGFIFAPIQTLAARTAVLETVARRIPVVIVDDELGPPPGPYLSYVENDEGAGVQMAAQRIAHLLPHGGAIAVIGISSHLESGVSREEAFEKALALTAPNVHIAERRYGDAVVTHQQQIAEQILHGASHVDLLLTLTAPATRGAFFAKIASTPRSTIPIVGFDQDMLLPVETGDVDAVVIQNTREIGRVAMRNLLANLHHEPVAGLTRIPPLLLTQKNLTAPEVTQLWQFNDYPWSQP